MTIAAHWKVFDRVGAEIDNIEKHLHEITGASVIRSESVNKFGNYDAHFILKGNIPAQNLSDACDFMLDADAFPV